MNRISNLDYEAVFIANDFLEIADYETIRRALNRMVDKGSIRRILRGVYYKPQFSELLHEYEDPSPHHVARAIARKFNWNIAPSGLTALNLLGLSTQVTAKWSFISDGTYNCFKFGNITLEFKHRNNREITGMSERTALIIQGIKALGKKNIDYNVIKRIYSLMSERERQSMLEEAKPTTAWVYKIIRKICGVE
jgi:hypothetical protein